MISSLLEVAQIDEKVATFLMTKKPGNAVLLGALERYEDAHLTRNFAIQN